MNQFVERRSGPDIIMRRSDEQKCYNRSLLLAATVATAFASGYQPIAILGWFQFFFLLRHLESIYPRIKFRHWLTAWAAISIGFTFAMAGSFNDPKWSAENVISVLVVAVVVTALEIVAAWVYVVIGQRHPHRVHAKILAFPVTMTAVWFFWGMVSPTGSYAHPALSQWTVPPIIQLASLFGLDGIIFLITWSASAVSTALELLWKPVEHYSFLESSDGEDAKCRSKARRHLKAWGWTLFIALIYGGANITVFSSDEFYQQSLPQTRAAKETLTMGCLIAEGIPFNQSTSIWNQTEHLAAAGNQIVIWSEEGLQVDTQEDEHSVLAQAGKICTQYSIYLGVTYQLASPEEEEKYQNIFTLLRSDGTVGFRYVKRHPVPVVETDAIPGHDSSPPYIDTPYGRIGGAICFDMDFPLYMKGAGQARVDLFLQPSWTWGPIGQLHAFDCAVRAVENGFGLFRCSSGGVSGYWDAQYGVQSLTYTSTDSHGPSQVIVPRPTNRLTLYPWLGFVFGWICLAAAVGYLIVLFGPAQRVIRRAATRVFSTRGSSGGNSTVGIGVKFVGEEGRESEGLLINRTVSPTGGEEEGEESATPTNGVGGGGGANSNGRKVNVRIVG